MDGHTWRNYRFVTERGSEPPFFLEPDNPDDWPGHFQGRGFRPLARYASMLNTDLDRPDPAAEAIARRMNESGIRIRPLDFGNFDEELHRVYAVSTVSFRNHLLYLPLSERDFLAHYLPFRSLVRPELVIVAERDGRCLGFIFALPDLLQSRRGGSVDTIIVKTLAVLPGREYAGCGLSSKMFLRLMI